MFKRIKHWWNRLGFSELEREIYDLMVANDYTIRQPSRGWGTSGFEYDSDNEYSVTISVDSKRFVVTASRSALTVRTGTDEINPKAAPTSYFHRYVHNIWASAMRHDRKKEQRKKMTEAVALLKNSIK